MNSELTERTDINEQPPLRATSNSPADSGHHNIKPGALLIAKSCSVPCRQRINPSESFRGWILYDDACSACTSSAKRFERLFRQRGFHFIPLQTEWVTRQLGLEPGSPPEEMHVLTAEGEGYRRRGCGNLSGTTDLVGLAGGGLRTTTRNAAAA
jgi:hypothetical protein